MKNDKEQIPENDGFDESEYDTIEGLEETNPSDKFESIARLENLIQGHLSDLQTHQKSLKEQSAMLRDAFENDASYAEVSQKAREIQKQKKAIKDKIMEEPAVSAQNDKVIELKSQVKETQQALSDYLTQYFEESGLRQITGTDGETHEIVTMVKLVKKRE